jgi:preprotein translocase subunit YajC
MDLLAAAAPFILVLLFFWFFLIRPQQRRQREVQRMQSAIAAGDRVMLTSGIFGTVVAISDERAEVEVAAGTRLEVMRAAIAKVEESTADEPGAVESADRRDEPGASPAADDEQA